MYIQELHLKNFKRFTDLKIDLSELPSPPRLVLLIGANGSGKSSVFDAFDSLSIYSQATRGLFHKGLFEENSISSDPASYYHKDKDQRVTIYAKLDNDKVLEVNSDDPTINANLAGPIFTTMFYGRSSLRQVPRLTRTSLGSSGFDLSKDSDRPRAYIDRDERFENDLETITRDILRYIYKSDQEKQIIFDNYIQPINEAFERIFEGQESIVPKLLSIIPPLDGQVAEIQFQKGEAEFHYDLLSSGEKEIFNILINLLSRRQYYQDTIYFFDEIDLHLNTRLQYNLLQEITEHWLPDNCQLWTASHSLGFIDYANDYDQAAIIDFDALDFDKPQTLYPSPKNRFDVFEVAVDQNFLAKVFEGKTIYFAENTDAYFYNNLRLENTIFFTARDKTDVFYKAKNTNYRGLIDRDFLTEEEVTLIRQTYPDLFILSYYSIENYFYHPENLQEYYQARGKPFDKEKYIKAWEETKQEAYDTLLVELKDARQSYPFFRENEYAKNLKKFRGGASALIKMFKSTDFETFYQVLPAKDIGREIPERINLNKRELGQTQWFIEQLQKVLS